ncbi:MAG: hypothetical protein WCI81_04590 [Chlorobiaceae bacterium]|jgi:uncharacterized membrane protein
MEKAVDYLAHHPVLFVIAVIVAFMILFSVLKKVVQVLLVIASLLVLYAAYLSVSGGQIPEAFHHIEHSVNNSFHFLYELFMSFMKFPKKELL